MTTEVVGVDGISYSPFANRQDLRELIRFNAGLDGLPAVEPDWLDVTGYLNRLDRAVGVNVALSIGNCAPRITVVGWDNVEATAGQVADMRSILREAMEQGAFGLSTGLDYAPGSYATTSERTPWQRWPPSEVVSTIRMSATTWVTAFWIRFERQSASALPGRARCTSRTSTGKRGLPAGPTGSCL